MLTKTCRNCGEEKELCAFSKQKAGKYGVQSQCKKCLNEKQNARYSSNSSYREDIKGRSRGRYKSDNSYRESVKVRSSQWRSENPDSVKSNGRMYNEMRRVEHYLYRFFVGEHYYLGRSSKSERFDAHVRDLKAGRHHNEAMQHLYSSGNTVHSFEKVTGYESEYELVKAHINDPMCLNEKDGDR